MKPSSLARHESTFLIAVFLSGFSAIVYQLVWTRYLHIIFGASVHAVSAVLACYMCGLALGSKMMGSIIDRKPEALRIYIGLEGTIAVLGLSSPLLFYALSELNSVLFQYAAADAHLKSILRFVMAFAVLAVPTICIGGTFPVMVKLYGRLPGQIGRTAGLLYFTHTWGSVMGAFAAGFFLIRILGLSRTLLLAAAINLVVCLIAYWVGPGMRPVQVKTAASVRTPAKARTPEPSTREASPAYSPSIRYAVLAVFTLSGFTSLSYEVFWTKLLTYFFRDTFYDFVIVLMAFLCGIGLGSLACAKWGSRISDPVRAFALVEIGIGLTAMGSLFLISRLPYLAGDLQTMTALYAKYGPDYWLMGTLVKFGFAFLVMLPPTLLFGAAYPLVSRIAVRSPQQAGGDIGRLNFFNTLGSAAGALSAGFVFISLLGIHQSILAMALLNIGLGVLLIALLPGRPLRAKLQMALPAVLAAVLLIAWVPPWDRLRMSISFLDPNQQLEGALDQLYYREDAYGITSVTQLRPTGEKFLTTNRLYSQNTSGLGGLEDHRRLGHIPLLLHPKPESALVIGLGAGITLRGVGEHPVTSIDCIEISGHVAEAVRFFEEANGGILEDPRVKIIHDDGRNYVTTTKKTYDTIIGDIYFPMSSGSSSMYSTEYFHQVRERLNPGGLYAQWLPAHQLSLEDIQSIAGAFRQAFPYASLWFGTIGESVPVVGLFGGERSPAADYSRLQQRITALSAEPHLNDMNLGSPGLLLSHFIMDEEELGQWTEGHPANTDDRPVIEFSAPRQHLFARNLGVSNLAHFSRQAGLPQAWIESAVTAGRQDRGQLQEELQGYSEAKRMLILGLAASVKGREDEEYLTYREALQRYPANEDLLFAYRNLR